MFYEFDLTIPANTSAASPEELGAKHRRGDQHRRRHQLHHPGRQDRVKREGSREMNLSEMRASAPRRHHLAPHQRPPAAPQGHYNR